MKSKISLVALVICLSVSISGCAGGSDEAGTDEAKQSSPTPKTVKDKIVGSWGVGMDYDDRIYTNLLEDATDEEAEALNEAIDRYTTISIQVEFKEDGTYVGVMSDQSSGSDQPIEGTWEITQDGEDEAKMNISFMSRAGPQEEVVDVEFLSDDRFRTQMFAMPQEVEGMFKWSYARNKS